MTPWRSLSLGAKLNLSLLGFLLLLGAATLAIIIYGFNRTQGDADARSNEALEQGGSLALQAVAGGAAEQGGLLFEAVAEVGQRSALYLGSRAQEADQSQEPPPEFETTATGHRYDPSPDRVTDTVVVNGAPPIDDARVLDDIAFTASLDEIFPVLLQSFAGEVGGSNLDPIAIVYISTNGLTRYYPPVGIQDRLPADADFTERMAALRPEQNPEHRTIWTAPYEDSAGQGLIVTARTPVYDGDVFRGSMEVDVSMSKVFAQIDRIRPTPGAFAFYVDANGTLLEGRSFPLLNNEVATNTELANALDAMRSVPAGDTSTFDAKLPLAGEDYYIAYNTVPGLGGTFAVAAPVSDLTTAAAGISSGIEEEGTRTLQVMVAAMAALFVAGLAGAAYLNRQAVVKPIGALVSATKAVAAGDLDTQVPVSASGDELGELGQSFNTMVEQLRESERTLEGRVEQRTRQLTTLLEVSRQIASERSIDELVQTLVRVADELFDTTGASIASVDEDGTATFLGTNYPDLAPIAIGMRYSLSEAGAIWNELRAGRGVVMANVRGEGEMPAAYRYWMGPELDGIYREIRSWMGVPFTVRGQLVAWMAISHHETDKFDEEDLTVAMATGNQAAVAFESARLFEGEARRSRELSALLDIARNVSSRTEFEPLLELILGQLHSVVQFDRAVVWVREDKALVVRAAHDFGGAAGYVTSTRIGDRLDASEAALPSWFNGDGPVIIDDVAGETPEAREYRAHLRPDRVSDPPPGSYMGIPLFVKDHVVGMLALARDQRGYYTLEHARLGRAIGSQIAVAIDNARLFEEAIQRTSELNTLLRADSELHRSLSLDAVLEALVDVMVDSLKADKCIISMAVPGSSHFAVRASRNMSQKSIDRINALHVAAGTRGPIEVTGIATYEDTSTMEPDIRAVLQDEGVASTLDAPIYTPDGVAGGFELGYTAPHTFTPNELRLAEAIAERAGVAIQNAQLVDEAAQRTRETEALLRADAELFRSLSLDSVLHALVDVTVDVLGADKSIVVLHDNEGGGIDVVRAARNYNQENLLIFNRTLAGMPHEEPPPEGQLPQVYVDIRTAPDFVSEALAREGIASHISIPIKDSERMLGLFGVSFATEHTFTEQEQRLYVAIADRAAVAIKNAELYERAQHAASLEERQRLARELHDSVSQALFGIALGARTARLRLDSDPATATEPVEYVMSLAQAGLAEMRALIFELRPESLENEGLVAALEKQTAAIEARHGIKVALDLGEEPDCRIEVKEALYRISQEALHNVVKHAEAANVQVTMVQDNGQLQLSIADDGIGFDSTVAYPGHVGLLSMPERAAKLGGTVSIDSTPKKGTTVIALLPT